MLKMIEGCLLRKPWYRLTVKAKVSLCRDNDSVKENVMKLKKFNSVLITVFVTGAIILIGCKSKTDDQKMPVDKNDPNFIKLLFKREVPEIAEGIVQVKAVARMPGYRLKVAVHSPDPQIDAVGACVGIEGSRIKKIVKELGNEKIDLIRWKPSPKVFINNALMPAKLNEVILCSSLKLATIIVDDEQMGLAIGKEGQNIRLAAMLTGWDLNLLNPDMFDADLNLLKETLLKVSGVDSNIAHQIIEMGLVNVFDVEQAGPELLIKELKLNRQLAQSILTSCAVEARKQQRLQ